jgi:hypothetical protein
VTRMIKFELTDGECLALVQTVHMATAIMRVLSNEVAENISLIELDSATHTIESAVEKQL